SICAYRHIAAAVYRTVIPHASLFFFNDAATTETYTLSLHDALPIFECEVRFPRVPDLNNARRLIANAEVHTIRRARGGQPPGNRSEEHTSELQSRENLVCRLLLEKKKKQDTHRDKIKHNDATSHDSR